MRRSIVKGVGAYLPEKVLTNDDLSQLVETSDEWIKQRTGIERRHIAADGELTCDLSAKAALAAMDNAALPPMILILLFWPPPHRTIPFPPRQRVCRRNWA